MDNHYILMFSRQGEMNNIMIDQITASVLIRIEVLQVLFQVSKIHLKKKIIINNQNILDSTVRLFIFQTK